MNIQKLRKKSNLTQKELGAKIEKTREFISRIERGVQNPSFKTLQSLAKVFNCEVKDLL